jgi:hypothetical protein
VQAGAQGLLEAAKHPIKTLMRGVEKLKGVVGVFDTSSLTKLPIRVVSPHHHGVYCE